MIELLNDLKLIITKYKETNDLNDKALCYRDYTYITDLLSTLDNPNFQSIQFDKKDYYEKIINKDKSYITKEIYDNRLLLESLYNRLIDSISPEVDEEEYDVPSNHREILINFFKQYHIDNIFIDMLDNYKILEDDNFVSPTTLLFKSINKKYILLSRDKEIDALPHEMGHIIESDIIQEDNHVMLEFISTLMELLFIDYYQKIDSKTANIMKSNFVSKLFYLMLSLLPQIEMMKRHSDAFTNMSLNNKYRDEYNSMTLFSNYIYDNELYQQYYAIGLLLSINFYYKLKKDNNLDGVIKFVRDNKNKSLYDLLSNNIDLSLLDNFINDFLGNNKRL